MWDVLVEVVKMVREALVDWPRTIRLLSVLAVLVIAVMLLR
jgi:hypothetical protein